MSRVAIRGLSWMAHGPLVKLLLRVWGHGSLDNCVKVDRRMAGRGATVRVPLKRVHPRGYDKT